MGQTAEAVVVDGADAVREVAVGRMARLAGGVGNVVEWYDFALFGASATLIAQALTSGGREALTTVLAVFALSFLVRPVGALLGAIWADGAGRRLPLLASISAMTLATAGIGLLPTWAQAPGLAVVALTGLRAVQGLATGAQFVVSVAYLVEHAPPSRRGLWGGMHMATMAVGFAGGMAAVALVTATLPPEAAEAWGWRVPFLLAVPLGLVVLLLRRRTPETPAYQELRNMRGGTGGRRFPSRALRRERAAVVHGFLLTAGLMSSFTLWFVYLPAHFAATGVFALHVVLASSLFGLLVAAASALVCGHASDRWGRRAVIISGLVVVGISWTLGYPALARGVEAALLPAYLVAGAGLGGLVVQSTLSEAFSLPVRVAGLAVSFGLASAVVGGTSPFVADLLVRISSTSVQFYALAWLAAAAGATVLLTRPRSPGVREAASGLPPPRITSVE